MKVLRIVANKCNAPGHTNLTSLQVAFTCILPSIVNAFRFLLFGQVAQQHLPLARLLQVHVIRFDSSHLVA